MCGVLPYANNIVKALAEGAHDMRALAHHVGTAMHSRPCNTMPVIGGERNICALFVGMANEAAESVECIVDVATQISHSRAGGHSFNNETKICRFTGELLFGFLADRLALAGVAQEQREILKFARLLRTALAIKKTGSEHLNKKNNLPRSCKKARR
jgi:hypothetical protein